MTRVNSPGSAVAEFGDVLGATVGAGCAGWRLSVEKLVFRELVVGAVSAAELDGSELVAPASPGVEPPPLDEGAVVVVGVGWADSLARSRWRWLQKESARATASRSAANRPQGRGRAGESEMASRRWAFC